MSTASTPPSASDHAADEKDVQPRHVEQLVTHDQVPGHPDYYEKNGLRTYGDGEDHDHEPPVGLPRFLCKPFLTLHRCPSSG